MYDDDSRGLETPDRPRVSATNNRVRSEDERDDSESPLELVGYRLEMIDYQSRKVLEEVADERTAEPHEAVRHLREIRAEVRWARRLLIGETTRDSSGDHGHDENTARGDRDE